MTDCLVVEEFSDAIREADGLQMQSVLAERDSLNSKILEIFWNNFSRINIPKLKEWFKNMLGRWR